MAVFQRTLRQRTVQMGRSTVGIWTEAPLQNVLMTVKVVALEKVCLSDTKNPQAVCEDIDSRWEALSAY